MREGHGALGSMAEQAWCSLLKAEQGDRDDGAAEPEAAEADTAVEVGEQADKGHRSGSDDAVVARLRPPRKDMVNKRLTPSCSAGS